MTPDCISKVARRADLKHSPPKKKKIFNYVMVISINQIYCGDYFVIYTNTESCCIPETKVRPIIPQ